MVDFKNTVLIMTSNLGAPLLLEGIDSDGNLMAGVEDAVMQELHNAFRPEFLNRLDEIVLFKPLTRDELGDILDRMLHGTEGRLEERGIRIELEESAKELILREGYDPAFGARPLRRYLQRTLETLLARGIISGEILDGEKVVLVEKNGQLEIEK
jgi:ATP-dependent Clp protease ATP-binding subunit ClpB